MFFRWGRKRGKSCIVDLNCYTIKDTDGEIVMLKYLIVSLSCLFVLQVSAGLPANQPEHPRNVANKRFFAYMNSICRGYNWRNVILSPFSIQQVFGVLYLGSDGNTARQINTYLGLNSASAPWLAETIASLKNDKNCVTFNSLVVNRYFSVDQRFLKAVRNYYASKLYWADFERPDKAAAALNRIIEGQSRGIFKDLLTPADISPDMVMAIMNVLYYKSDWRYKFDRNHTVQLNFTNAYNQNKLVNMMFLKKFLPYFYDSQTQIHGVVLPYENPRFEMVLMMPFRQYTTVESILQHLAHGKLENLLAQASSLNQTEVLLPRMDLSAKVKMADSLCKFGVTDAFSPMLADFSGLGVSSAGRVYLKEVLHFVRLKVDEDGSEGSAVTVALPEAAAFLEEKINYFRADHPFVLLLRDKLTGAVLFAAVVNDLPSVEQLN